MGRWAFPNITDEYHAVVSTHGWYEIQRANGSFTGYHSTVWPVRGFSEPPTPVDSGATNDIGITYDLDEDDLIEEHDNYDFIKARLLQRIAHLSGGGE